jgi:hypothetical protein
MKLTLQLSCAELGEAALRILRKPFSEPASAEGRREVDDNTVVEVVQQKEPVSKKAMPRVPRPVGWFRLPRSLREPIQHVVLYVAGIFAKARIRFRKEDPAERHGASNTKLQSSVEQENAKLVLDACDRWWDGEEFTELPLDVLRNCGEPNREDPYLMHFLASNFFERAQFEEAAECFIDAFRHPQSSRFDERQHVRQLLREYYGQDLDSVLSSPDHEGAVRLIRESLKRRYEERECRLADLAKRRARAAQKPKVPNVSCSAAISYLMERFPSEIAGVAADSPTLHLVLFYADALCVRQHGQRLYGSAHPVVAARNGLMYRLGDIRSDESCSVRPEHKPLLEASFEAVGILSEAELSETLRREPMWMASKRDAELTTTRMKRFFGQHTDFRQSATFHSVCERFHAIKSLITSETGDSS